MRRLNLACLSLTLVLAVASSTTFASPLTPDWSENATIDPYGRANPYGWDEATLAQKERAGRLHALNYPVTVTGLLLPEKPTIRFLNAKPGEPLFAFLKTVLSLKDGFENFTGIWDWMGLHNFPDQDSDAIPYLDGKKPVYPMGVTLMERNHDDGLTFSCAVCHSAEFFGKPILGMTNRFPQANAIFVLGKDFLHKVSPTELGIFAGASQADQAMYKDSRENIKSVGTKKPSMLGLDSALSQVALSLARRTQSPWAERDDSIADHPRANLLDTRIADSKPLPWWLSKYKTRWLSDGSVVSGNPIETNIIWNELGRGADLKVLDQWMQQNQTVFEELTTAVFATKAPKWNEFLGDNTINLYRAKQGEALFQQNCVHCHGQYEKAWSLSTADFDLQKRLHPELTVNDTVRVKYFSKTPVVDVGTDPGRSDGSVAIAEALNPLTISKEYGILNVPQKGYIPPPLDGIFARYPYLHNNSIPNLCALMTEPSKRPTTYTSGMPIDPKTDFDQTCVGYPIADKTPKAWLAAKDADLHLFDARKEGLSKGGHYEGIFTNADGSERYTNDEKFQIIEFMKTL